jgi:DNA repair protein RecN (Recombination protein N)
MLVDLHGQHEHQSLLYPETHIQMLDDYAGLDGLLFEYQKSYRLLASLFAELDSLRGRERELHEKRDLYMFQIQEIDELSPQSGEEHTLNAEALILENAEKLFQSTQQVHQILYEGEHSVYDLVVQVRNQLEDLCHIDPSFAEAKNEAVSTVAIIGELAKFIQSYNSRIEFNAERLEEIRERLGRLTLLKKKYGGSIDSTIDYRQRIGKEFSLAENYEEEIRRLEAKIEDERKRCSETAQRLSSKRREYATKIESFIIDELFKLGIKNAQFNVKIENHRILNKEHKHFFVTLGNDIFESNDLGFDYVEFYISTNLGEDVRPLVKVASGGEVSRVMLALKTILAKSERLPAMVFDEIDVGISGRIAQSVGRSLKNLSRFHQIIAITHLPQIAGLADTHFAVEKVEQKKRSVTRIRKLDENERIREVAKLMSGEEITEAGLEGAKELMGL